MTYTGRVTVAPLNRNKTQSLLETSTGYPEYVHIIISPHTV